MIHKKGMCLRLLLTQILFSCLVFANPDWDGQAYSENSDPQYNWVIGYIEELPLAGHEHILDIGSGDGKLTQILKNRIPKGTITGMDQSESMVAFSQKTYPGITFVQQKAEDLQAVGQFDLITSFSCLHWVEDKEKAAHNMHRALKPGGKILLYFAPDEGAHRLDHAIEKIAADPQWGVDFSSVKSGFYLVTEKTFRAYLEKAGFHVDETKVVTTHEQYRSKEDFAKWIKTWLPHTKLLKPERHDPFVMAIIDEYLSHYPKSDTVHYYDYMLKVLAHKQ